MSRRADLLLKRELPLPPPACEHSQLLLTFPVRNAHEPNKYNLLTDHQRLKVGDVLAFVPRCRLVDFLGAMRRNLRRLDWHELCDWLPEPADVRFMGRVFRDANPQFEWNPWYTLAGRTAKKQHAIPLLRTGEFDCSDPEGTLPQTRHRISYTPRRAPRRAAVLPASDDAHRALSCFVPREWSDCSVAQARKKASDDRVPNATGA